jgi:hypothetical protein
LRFGMTACSDGRKACAFWFHLPFRFPTRSLGSTLGNG